MATVDEQTEPGEAEAFTAFAERAGRQLRQALVAAYGPEVGADVTADALAYGWEHWQRIRAMRNPAGYLYRVGQSSARRGIFRRPAPVEPPARRRESYWFEPDLEAAIAALPQRQRAAVVLVHGYGWTISEVAHLWDVGFSTVRRHLDRGMASLRHRLGVEA